MVQNGCCSSNIDNRIFLLCHSSLLSQWKSKNLNLEVDEFSKFIDYDKNEKIFYNNVYLKEFKIVIKMPMCLIPKENTFEEIKIEKFNLAKYTYLLSYVSIILL